ncbi:MAG: ATP-dependent sacrificial sulfur transferase LarE [bacterium]
MDCEKRLNELRAAVRALGSALIAFSGGVDSALLARVASDELAGRVVLATAESATYTQSESERAKELALAFGAPHVIIKTNEFEDPLFRANPPDRCYHCKRELMARLEQIRKERGFDCIADGTNADDAGDFRPGERAGREFGVRSPLAEIGLTKTEIRGLAKHLGLPNWDQPAAACLASRIPYGMPIEGDVLRRIAAAEAAVIEASGIRQTRVRHHGELARIEVPSVELERLASPALRVRIVEALRALGYHYVTIDMQGYRTGSMNEALSDDVKNREGGGDGSD